MSPEEKAVPTKEAGVEEEVVVPPGAAEDENPDESATPEAEREAPEVTGDEEAETEEVQKPKRLGGFQRRIQRLNARVEAAQAESDHWREQAQRRQQEEKPPAVEAKSKPKPSDFAIKEEDGGGFDQTALTEALVKWEVQERLSERDATARESQFQTERQRQNQEFQEREDSFAETLPENPPEGEGYEEVTSVACGVLEQLKKSPATRNVTMEISGAIATSEKGPQLLYFLGNNPDELQRIAKLSPRAAVMSLGAIEAKLAENTQEKGQETRTPVVSGAPPPPAPIRRPSGGKKHRPDDPATAGQMSAEEWLKARRAQVRSRARG